MATEVQDTREVIQKINTYQEYQRGEGIPIHGGFSVPSLKTVEVGPWARRGGQGAFINLEGTEGVNDAYVVEIPPGASLNPQRQLFEEMIYVVDGNGSSQVWYDENRKATFEWKAGSLFAMPVNAWHRHFNGRGDRPARFMAVTNAPVVMNLFHNLRFVFETSFVFDDRFAGQEDYFSGEGVMWRNEKGNRWTLETNLVPDAHSIQLYEWKERGAGGRNITFELAHNTMAAHISEFPVGTYKKAHRHGPGAHVIILNGQGYSLLWPDIDDEPRKVDWRAGSMVVPPNLWFHQHFNSGAEPARYLALRWGSRRYDMGGAIRMEGEGKTDLDVKQGGAQIEYPDENRKVHDLFESELAKSSTPCGMRSMIAWCTGK
jgi:quercetin dioxygenase-like cupin family protein